MKWIPQDIETYLNVKEYVDTVVVPLYGISMDKETKQSAEAAEFITLLTTRIERQFTGRLILFPPFTYLKKDPIEKALADLFEWHNVLKADFKHIFYLTSDSDWRLKEDMLQGTLIWLPSIPLKSMNDSQKFELIDNQSQQLFSILTDKWIESE